MKKWWFSIVTFAFAIAIILFIVFGCIFMAYDDVFIYSLLIINCASPIMLLICIGEASKPEKDSEEDLGIKALKNGFYYKRQGIIVHTSERESYIFLSAKSCLPNQMCIEVHFGDLETMWFYFEDYGKTWALTRKELETRKGE